MNDIFIFLRKPQMLISYDKELRIGTIAKIRVLSKLFLITIIFLVISAIIGILLDKILIHLFLMDSIYKARDINIHIASQYLGKFKPYYIIIVGPLIEELIFRLPLQISERSISFSFGAILYLFFGFGLIHFNFYAVNSYLILLLFIVLLPIVVTTFIKRYQLLKFITKHYILYFYIIAILFAFMHIPNFKPFNYKIFYLYPIFVLPQFISGLSLGYARNKFGIQYSWLFHAFLNVGAAFLMK